MAAARNTLETLLARVEEKKRVENRKRLGIAPELKIGDLELECLATQLLEQDGDLALKMEAGAIRLGSPGILYRGDAAKFILSHWKISQEQAREGCVISRSKKSQK